MRVITGYVLIDTDQGIGKINDILQIYRMDYNTEIYIGQIRLRKFQNGKTGAKIIYTEPGYKMQVGDFVKIKSKDIEDIPILDTYDMIYDNKKNNNYETKQTKENDLAYDIFIEDEGYTKQHINTKKKSDKHNQISAHLGIFTPSSSLVGTVGTSPNIGINYMLVGSTKHSLYVDLTIPIMKTKSQGVKSSLIILNLFDRIKVKNRLYYDLGIGLYNSSTKIGSKKIESGSNFGFLIGFSIDLFTSWGISFTPSIKIHSYNTKSDWKDFAVFDLNMFFTLFP
jgi:hypothetical protein